MSRLWDIVQVENLVLSHDNAAPLLSRWAKELDRPAPWQQQRCLRQKSEQGRCYRAAATGPLHSIQLQSGNNKCQQRNSLLIPTCVCEPYSNAPFQSRPAGFRIPSQKSTLATLAKRWQTVLPFAATRLLATQRLGELSSLPKPQVASFESIQARVGSVR